MKLTVCIATHNEIDTIDRVLKSVIDWVDEVVIVDGASTDDTVKRAQSYGPKVKIIETTNKPMFHLNKQMALDSACGDWILQLDADEEVTDNLQKEILGIFNDQFSNSNSNIFAYQIPRVNYFLGKPLLKGGVYPDYTIRLYKRGSMYFPCKDVHENVTPVGRHPELVEGSTQTWLGTLEHPMNHYSDPTFTRYLTRWSRYNKAEAKRVKEEALRLYGQSARYSIWKVKFITTCIFWLPIIWFVRTYIRHLGFMDGWQGLVFHFMSAMRWWGIATNVMTSSKF